MLVGGLNDPTANKTVRVGFKQLLILIRLGQNKDNLRILIKC